jgi:hypothetical protein
MAPAAAALGAEVGASAWAAEVAQWATAWPGRRIRLIVMVMPNQGRAITL